MTISSQGISIVVPTYKRVAFVERLLRSIIVAQKSFAGTVQVLIVDDSPTKESEQIRAACAVYPNVEYVRGESSVRKKRNLGIERARFPIVLFVDSDCEATPSLLSEHAQQYDGAEPGLGGIVGVTEFVGPDTIMWRVICATQFLNAFSFAKRMEYAPWATCSNTSYKTQILRELGGFDATFPFKLGGDDVDLGLRLNKAGYKLKSNPRAVVLHTRETWNSFIQVWRKAWRWGRMDLHLYYHKHSDRIVPTLPKFGTILVLLILVALVAVIQSQRLAVLIIPIVWAVVALLLQAYFTVRRAGQSFSHIGYEFLADILGLTFELGTMWEGIRHLDFSPFYKNVKRGPVLPIFEQQEWLIQHWSMLLALIFVLLIIPWLE